jgi:hypothetical protein
MRGLTWTPKTPTGRASPPARGPLQRLEHQCFGGKVQGQTWGTATTAPPVNLLRIEMRQTLTYDKGREMVRHQELTWRTGVKVYVCDPHSPWRRGTCAAILNADSQRQLSTTH